MDAWHIWIIIGIIFFIIEIFTPAFFFASLGIGAFITSIAAYYDYSMTAQISALSGGTFIVFIGVRPLLKLLQSAKGDNRTTGIDALIGQKAIVIKQIDNANNWGRIKLGGEEWKACSINGEILEESYMVVVEKIEGVTAYVKQTDNN